MMYGIFQKNLDSNTPARLGLNTSEPTEVLHLDGSIRMVDGNEGVGRVMTDAAGNGVAVWTDAGSLTVRTVSISDDAELTDDIIYVDTDGITITLYTAVGNTGRHLYIDNDSGGEIDVDGDGVELIENELTQTMPNDSAMHIYSNGVGWRII